jgi:hypothetical protein
MCLETENHFGATTIYVIFYCNCIVYTHTYTQTYANIIYVHAHAYGYKQIEFVCYCRKTHVKRIVRESCSMEYIIIIRIFVL